MFSDAERCLYGKPQLVEVICQLRFPTILKIENQSPFELQELIRGDYPNYSVREERLNGQNGAPPTTQKNYQFLSMDNRWKVNLTQGFISLASHGYTRWEDFAKRLDKLLAHLIGVYHPACFTRIGLRYINAFNQKLLELDDLPWRELIHTPYLGLMGEEDVAEKAFLKCEQSATLNLPGGARSNIKSGRGTMRKVDNKNRAVSEQEVFMLDIDVFMDGSIGMSHIAPALNVVHGNADSIFRGAITDTLHNAMEPSPL